MERTTLTAIKDPPRSQAVSVLHPGGDLVSLVRSLATALACIPLAGCGHLYRPLTPREATSASTRVRAETLEVRAHPTFSLAPPETRPRATLSIETTQPARIEGISMASRAEEGCGAGAAAQDVSVQGEKRIWIWKLPTTEALRLPDELSPGSRRFIASFAGRTTSEPPPASIDVTFRDDAGSEGGCLRVPLQDVALEASWAERPRTYVALNPGVAFHSRAGTSGAWEYRGRVGVGRWVGPVRAGLEYSSPTTFAIAGDLLVRRWHRAGVASGLAYEVSPDGPETRHGPRAGLRLDWLPVPTGWPGYEDHPAPSALGLEFQVSRWWGASEAPDTWVFRVGIAAYLGF